MRIDQQKKELLVTIEEDTSMNVSYVDGIYLSDVIDNSTDDPDWDDYGQAYRRHLTIDAGGNRLSIEVTGPDPKVLEFKLAEPPKRRRREAPPDWLIPKLAQRK